mgnify:CR=1 FL=1
MKNIRRYLGLTLLMFAVVVMSSCIKENLSETNKSESATVTLRVNESRSDLTSPNEGIKTLRVIVVNKSTNLVEFNFKQDYRGEANPPLTQKTITFMGMTTGEKDFYVVANEESIGLTEESYPIAGGKFEEGFLSYIVKDATRESFPKLKSEIEEKGLPITGYKKVSVSGNANIDIDIYYAVAKISLSFINNTGSDISIGGFTLGSFLENGTSLFKEGGVLTDQDNVTSSSGTKEVNKVIKAGSFNDIPDNKDLLVFYVYETDEEPDNYKIALTSEASNVSIGTLKQFLTQKSILRNNWIQVVATINLNAKEINIDFNFSVRKWDEKEIDVPSFS